jgi:predicted nucleotidyltransferase
MLVEKVLGSKSKINLLKLFYDFPRREFCLDDLSRNLKCSTGTIYPALTDLVSLRVILAIKAGRSTFYRLNYKNPLIKKLIEIFDAERQFLMQIARNFTKKLDKTNITSVIIFGSVARGEATTMSDIDLLIIFEKNHKIVEKKVSKLTDKYLEQDVNISPIFFSKKEIKKMIKRYDSFALRVQEEGKVLFGKSLKEIENG